MCRAVLACGRSPNRAEIVGGVTCDAFEVVTQGWVCLGMREEIQQLVARNPSPAPLADRDDLGDWLAAHGDDDFVSVLDAPEHAGGVVAQFAGRDVSHGYNCSPFVGLSRRSRRASIACSSSRR